MQTNTPTLIHDLRELARNVSHDKRGYAATASEAADRLEQQAAIRVCAGEKVMSIIYLVTSGEYSSYGIEGAFSTREKAEEYVAWSDIHTAGCVIEEYVVDSAKTKPHTQWSFYMDMDGNTTQMTAVDPDSQSDSPDRWGWIVTFGNRALRWFTINADTLERAVKIANERRAQLLAANQWDIKHPSIAE
jgi:hypothetical protein